MAIYGGEPAAGSILSDTWEWDGISWAQRTGIGTAPVRGVPSVAYDLARQRMVFFGGFNATPQSGTWELGTTWTNPTPTNPPAARHGAAMGYDAATSRVMLVGGVDASYVPQAGAWTYDGSAWTALATDTGARGWVTMVSDSTRSRLILFGGYDAASTALADTWEY